MKVAEPFHLHGQMSDSFRAAVFIILSGGFQDAYTYFCRGEVFANAQTGNIVFLSTALFQKDWPNVVKYLIPVVSFLIGTAAAELIHICFKTYESTMCIVNMRSGTEALCAYFRTRDKEILQKSLTYFGVIFVFGIGAGLGSLMSGLLGTKAIWCCCVSLLVSFVMMFVPEKNG